MIITSDHSIITTPVESSQTDVLAGALSVKENSMHTKSQNETPTSETSEEITLDNSKKRHKARSDSTRSTKYENFFFTVWFTRCASLKAFIPFLPFLKLFQIYF